MAHSFISARVSSVSAANISGGSARASKFPTRQIAIDCGAFSGLNKCHAGS